MAWIKLDHTTPDKPEIFAMADALGLEPEIVFFKLVKLWIWFDQQCANSNALGVTSKTIDRYVGVNNWAKEMANVGWLALTDDGLTVPNFDRHNGETSKARALTAKRTTT